jgi:hypothetical protein
MSKELPKVLTAEGVDRLVEGVDRLVERVTEGALPA